MTEAIVNSSAGLTPILSNARIIECLNENQRNFTSSKNQNKFLNEENLNQFQIDKCYPCLNDANAKLSSKVNKLLTNRIINNRRVYKKDLSTSSENNMTNQGPHATNEKLLAIHISNSLHTDPYLKDTHISSNRSDSASPTISNLIKISIDTDQTDCETAHEVNYSPKKSHPDTDKKYQSSPSFNKSSSLNAEDGLLPNENFSFTSSEFCRVVKDFEANKETIRNKPNLKVQDLALKLPKLLERKMMNYPRLIIAIATFYVLPVIQLILLYQTQLNKSGNEDSCYFNFLCMMKQGPFAAFNNVFSNVGYVLLGIMFIIVVKKRSYSYTYMRKKYPSIMASHGIPQHFGLFYTMGIGLVMEGILSAAYHVCPSYNNFQFDTSFMYIIGVISTIKL